MAINDHEVILVKLRIIEKEKKLVCEPQKVKVYPNDIIVWEWAEGRDCPFGIVIISPFTPLSEHFFVTELRPGSEKKIEAKILQRAPAGHFPYLAAAYINGEILVEDPEIIVRPPKDEGK